MISIQTFLFWLFYISLAGIIILFFRGFFLRIVSWVGKKRTIQKKVKEVLQERKKILKKKSPQAEESSKQALPEEALGTSQIKKSPKKVSAEVSPLLRKGEAFMARNNFDEAKKIFLKVLAWDEENCDACSHLAYAYLKTGEFTKAEALFKKVIPHRQKDASLLTNYALCLLEQRDPKRAEESSEALEKALEIEPNNAERYSNLGQALFFMGDTEGAIVAFEKALHIHPRNTEYLFFYADSLIAAEKKQEAKAIFQKIADLYPLNEEAKEEVRKLTEQGV